MLAYILYCKEPPEHINLSSSTDSARSFVGMHAYTHTTHLLFLSPISLDTMPSLPTHMLFSMPSSSTTQDISHAGIISHPLLPSLLAHTLTYPPCLDPQSEVVAARPISRASGREGNHGTLLWRWTQSKLLDGARPCGWAAGRQIVQAVGSQWPRSRNA